MNNQRPAVLIADKLLVADSQYLFNGICLTSFKKFAETSEQTDFFRSVLKFANIERLLNKIFYFVFFINKENATGHYFQVCKRKLIKKCPPLLIEIIVEMMHLCVGNYISEQSENPVSGKDIQIHLMRP